MDMISTIISAAITSGITSIILGWIIETNIRKEQRRWEIKHEACLEALEIIDSRFADYPWESDGKRTKVDKQNDFTTAEIRSCFNRLVLSCKDPDVPRLFEKCLHLEVSGKENPPLKMETIVEFRTAIRKELGLGKKEIRTAVSWITYITRFNDEKKDGFA
jgi:hypothetical protein